VRLEERRGEGDLEKVPAGAVAQERALAHTPAPASSPGLRVRIGSIAAAHESFAVSAQDPPPARRLGHQRKRKEA
jgi:hypothetical protein